MRARVLVAISTVVLTAALALPGSALAASGSGGGPAAQPHGRLKMKVQVDSFYMRGRQTLAHGTVTTNLNDLQGQHTTLRSPVTLAVRGGGSCDILDLQLDELTLNLLGLNVHLDKVVLSVTGKAHGGVLGSLFCKLAHSQVKGRRAAVRTLNENLRHHPLTPLSFSVPLSKRVVAAQSPSPTCQVLNLILGPLNLNLLGLVVTLNQVHLTITAVPGAGNLLGNLLCSLVGLLNGGGSLSAISALLNSILALL